MAVFRAFNDRRQYFDTNGNPLSGGFVFWYLAGTTTKSNTYNSSAGSVANANPMTLDSAGRFASEVWLTGGVSYKMVITASTDTADPPNSPIWTEDNIRGIDDPGTTITGEWIVSSMTPTYISASSFSVPGDQTSILHVGRRLQITDAGGTKYATILTSTFGAITTLTLTVDNSGSLSNPVSSFNYGIVSAVNTSNPFTVFQNILPRSLAPNPFFEVDQRANSATSVADDNYGHDRWYVLTQTASIQVSTQTLQENGQTANARLTQNQAAAQRMGYACILESKEAQKLRGQTMTFKPRIRCSSSQAIRCAVVEWTGTADVVTSDIVNDWTSSDYTDGAARFFVDANLTPLGTSAVTPSAATWTDATQLPVTVSSSCNNLILFVWTEGTAAQNVTLDIGKVRFVPGNYTIGDIYIPLFSNELMLCRRYCEVYQAQSATELIGVGQVINTNTVRVVYPLSTPSRLPFDTIAISAAGDFQLGSGASVVACNSVTVGGTVKSGLKAALIQAAVATTPFVVSDASYLSSVNSSAKFILTGADL